MQIKWRISKRIVVSLLLVFVFCAYKIIKNNMKISNKIV